jgi:predicted nuclease of predicted toxin-antitoxin system
MNSPDREIWNFAKANGFVVVGTDLVSSQRGRLDR